MINNEVQMAPESKSLYHRSRFRLLLPENQPYLIWIGAWSVIATASNALPIPYLPLYAANESCKWDSNNYKCHDCNDCVSPFVVCATGCTILVYPFSKQRTSNVLIITVQILEQNSHSCIRKITGAYLPQKVQTFQHIWK